MDRFQIRLNTVSSESWYEPEHSCEYESPPPEQPGRSGRRGISKSANRRRRAPARFAWVSVQQADCAMNMLSTRTFKRVSGFTMLFLHVLLQSEQCSPAFVGVTFRSSSGNVVPRDFGCHPTLFSANPTSATLETPLVVLSGDGCDSGAYGDSVKGSSVAVLLYDTAKGNGCSVSRRVALAKAAGAVGVVFKNFMPGEIPYMRRWQYTQLMKGIHHDTRSPSGIDMLACMVSYEDGLSLESLTEGSETTARLDWGKFQRWDINDEPDSGTYTVFSILSPQTIKDDWPASHASFNPSSHASISANVVLADFVDDCLPVPQGESVQLSFYCDACWANSVKFKNTAEELKGSILLYREPYSICYPSFYDLGYISQEVEAGAVIVALPGDRLPIHLAYHLVPYVPKIPLHAIQNYVGNGIAEVESAGNSIHALVHKITNRRGPSYYAPTNYHETLPETDLDIETSCSSNPSASEAITVQAGQATFNPEIATAISDADILELGLAPECARSGGAPKTLAGVEASKGVDCTACFEKIAAQTAIAINSLTGKVGFLDEWQAFCMNSLLDVAAMAEAAGAVAILVGNQRDMTMTVSGGVSQSGATSSSIPMYNVKNSVADKIRYGFQNSCAVKVSLPTIQDGSAPATSSVDYDDKGGSLTPTQIRFRKRTYSHHNRRLHEKVHSANYQMNQETFAHRTLTDAHMLSGSLKHGIKAAGRALQSSSDDDSAVIEVGQTLFQPRSHPGLNSGSGLVRGRLRQACGGYSCSKCNLYASPLESISDYEDRVVVFSIAEAHCIRPLSQYVYFAQEAGAVGVLFLSDWKEAHLETLGPPTVDFTPRIPSFVVPQGMFEEKYYSWELQTPSISNGIAAEKVGTWPAPVSPFSDEDLLEQEAGTGTDGSEQEDDGGDRNGNPGVLIVLSILLSACFCVLGWKCGKVVYRRNQRGKLRPIGRMTHTSETQTGGKEEEDRVLIGNPSNFSSTSSDFSSVMMSTSTAADYGIEEEQVASDDNYYDNFYGDDPSSTKHALEDTRVTPPPFSSAGQSMVRPPPPPVRMSQVIAPKLHNHK